MKCLSLMQLIVGHYVQASLFFREAFSLRVYSIDSVKTLIRNVVGYLNSSYISIVSRQDVYVLWALIKKYWLREDIQIDLHDLTEQDQNYFIDILFEFGFSKWVKINLYGCDVSETIKWRIFELILTKQLKSWVEIKFKQLENEEQRLALEEEIIRQGFDPYGTIYPISTP